MRLALVATTAAVALAVVAACGGKSDEATNDGQTDAPRPASTFKAQGKDVPAGAVEDPSCAERTREEDLLPCRLELPIAMNAAPRLL